MTSNVVQSTNYILDIFVMYVHTNTENIYVIKFKYFLKKFWFQMNFFDETFDVHSLVIEIIN